MKTMIVLNYPKYRLQLMSYHPVAEIPNHAGFQCVVKHRGGFEAIQTVRCTNGHYHLDLPLAVVTGWRTLTEEDRAAAKEAD